MEALIMKKIDHFIEVYRSMNQGDAESIRLLLDSFQIPVELIGESAGKAIGLGVGPLGEVSVYVSKDRAKEATNLIHRMETGEFNLPTDGDDPGKD
jgi:hypothetical protein